MDLTYCIYHKKKWWFCYNVVLVFQVLCWSESHVWWWFQER